MFASHFGRRRSGAAKAAAMAESLKEPSPDRIGRLLAARKLRAPGALRGGLELQGRAVLTRFGQR